jgi:hypothetical protein
MNAVSHLKNEALNGQGQIIKIQEGGVVHKSPLILSCEISLERLALTEISVIWMITDPIIRSSVINV